jgi:hypothetical protein
LNKEVVDGESWPMRKNPVKKWLKNSKEMVNCKEFSGVKKEEIASFSFMPFHAGPKPGRPKVSSSSAMILSIKATTLLW